MFSWFILFVMAAGAIFCAVDFARGLARHLRAREAVRGRLALEPGMAAATFEAQITRGKETPRGGFGGWLTGIVAVYKTVSSAISLQLLAGTAAAGLGFGAVATYVALGQVGLALFVGLGFGLAGPGFVLLQAQTMRRTACDKQLPEALDLIMRSLRAGHPLQVAVATAGRDVPAPLGEEFALASKEMSFGLDLESALTKMARRIGTEDADMLAVVVRVQQRAGGNLVEILQRFSELMRERFRMRAKAMALSSEGRVSGILLTVLPFIMFALIQATSPSYYAMVRGDPIVPWVFGVTFALMMIGGFVIYRMVNFRI